MTQSSSPTETCSSSSSSSSSSGDSRGSRGSSSDSIPSSPHPMQGDSVTNHPFPESPCPSPTPPVSTLQDNLITPSSSAESPASQEPLSMNDAVLLFYFKAVINFIGPWLRDVNTEEEEAVLDKQRGAKLSQQGIDQAPDEIFDELMKLSLFLKFLTVGAVFYGTQVLGHYDSSGCVRATLGLTAGYLIAPFCNIEPLTSQVYRLFKDDVPAPSSEQLRDTLNTVGLTLLVLLIVPRYTQGWDLQTDLQLAVPVMTGWAVSDAVDSLAIAWYLQRR
ncbi:MAG: hypothetical protein WDW36_007948 [Sanguina aurantia]